jgi:hypothetical protein
MPALGDYLGALLSEVTNARLLADLETARIAQLYASHPLLQHMPVPRFRLPTVSIDLPVAVEGQDQPPVAPQATQLAAIRQALDTIVAGQLSQGGLHLTPSRQKRLGHDLNDLFDRLQAATAGFSAADVTKALGDAVALVVDAIKASGPDSTSLDPSIESSLLQQFGVEFLKLQPPPPRVQVMVVTSQLKDIAPPLTLTRIQLTISEEGVEWNQTNPDDASSKTLLPE